MTIVIPSLALFYMGRAANSIKGGISGRPFASERLSDVAMVKNPQPDQKDVIAEQIEEPPHGDRWGVFVGTTLTSEHETRMEAEMAALDIAHERGVGAWLRLDWGRYKKRN